MDPQTAWEELLAAYAAGDWDRVEELADSLVTWLQSGGFPPRAVTGDDMGDAWDRALALAGCRFALAKAREEGSHAT
jgi:hypothetical protein